MSSEGGWQEKSSSPFQKIISNNDGECKDSPDIDYFTEVELNEGEIKKYHTDMLGEYSSFNQIEKIKPTIYQTLLRDDLSIETPTLRAKNEYKPDSSGKGGKYRNGQPTPATTGFVIVMHRNMNLEGGKKFITFQQNGIYSDHAHYEKSSKGNRTYTHRNKMEKQIVLEKLKKKIVIHDEAELLNIAPSMREKRKNETHPFYDYAMNLTHQRFEQRKDFKYSNYADAFKKNIECIVKENAKFHSQQYKKEKRAWEQFRTYKKSGLLEKQAQNLFRAIKEKEQPNKNNKLTLKKYLQDYFDPEIGFSLEKALIEEGAQIATDKSGGAATVVHKIQMHKNGGELLITPGVGEETQIAALIYAQSVFDECCKNFHLADSGKYVGVRDLGVGGSIPLRLVSSHRHIFYPSAHKDETKTQSKYYQWNGGKKNKKWIIGETYMFVAKHERHDAIVAAVTRPKLRTDFTKFGHEYGAVEPYLYLPYFAHRIWNQYMKWDILLRSGQVQEGKENVLKITRNTLLEQLKKNGMLKFVKYANLLRKEFEKTEPLVDHTYVPWVDFMADNPETKTFQWVKHTDANSKLNGPVFWKRIENGSCVLQPEIHTNLKYIFHQKFFPSLKNMVNYQNIRFEKNAYLTIAANGQWVLNIASMKHNSNTNVLFPQNSLSVEMKSKQSTLNVSAGESKSSAIDAKIQPQKTSVWGSKPDPKPSVGASKSPNKKKSVWGSAPKVGSVWGSAPKSGSVWGISTAQKAVKKKPSQAEFQKKKSTEKENKKENGAKKSKLRQNKRNNNRRPPPRFSLRDFMRNKPKKLHSMAEELGLRL